jgi:hypothetical protein
VSEVRSKGVSTATHDPAMLPLDTATGTEGGVGHRLTVCTPVHYFLGCWDWES